MTKTIRTWLVAVGVLALIVGCAPKAQEATQGDANVGTATAQKTDAGKTDAGKAASTKAPRAEAGKTVPDGDAKTPPPSNGKTRPAPPPPPAQTKPVRSDAALRDVVGKWTMDLPGISKAMNADLKKKGKAQFGGSLEIKADGSYEFKFGLMGQQAVTKGRATLQGGVLTLKATDDGKGQIKAQPKGTDYRFKLSQDGKQLLSDMKERGNLNFTRG